VSHCSLRSNVDEIFTFVVTYLVYCEEQSLVYSVYLSCVSVVLQNKLHSTLIAIWLRFTDWFCKQW